MVLHKMTTNLKKMFKTFNHKRAKLDVVFSSSFSLWLNLNEPCCKLNSLDRKNILINSEFRHMHFNSNSTKFDVNDNE